MKGRKEEGEKEEREEEREKFSTLYNPSTTP